jgi:ABC-type multidrug transport system fused ATPase/permease subunit
MDEATSSIDQKTDFTVQKTIQREFVNKGVSVITVAHRLDTILGYDKIAVFGAGQLLEYDTPTNLLARSNGELRMLFDAYRKNRQRGLIKTIVPVELVSQSLI